MLTVRPSKRHEEVCFVQVDYKSRNNPEEIQKRAMADPEIGRILADPAMQIILSQIEKDPKALRE